jgi:hypothetical protein
VGPRKISVKVEYLSKGTSGGFDFSSGVECKTKIMMDSRIIWVLDKLTAVEVNSPIKLYQMGSIANWTIRSQSSTCPSKQLNDSLN